MLRYVHWPQIRPLAAAAWYIVFLLCLWDVESMILVTPPGGETLALRIFNLLHYGHNAQVNALCLTLLGLALAPLVLWRAWRVAGSAWGVVRGAWERNAQPATRNTIIALCAVVLLTSCAASRHAYGAPLGSGLI